jgi:hypothetical protein
LHDAADRWRTTMAPKTLGGQNQLSKSPPMLKSRPAAATAAAANTATVVRSLIIHQKTGADLLTYCIQFLPRFPKAL